MDVRFTPDVEEKLNRAAAQSGRAAEEFLQDALACYFEELSATQTTLSGRFDELKSGAVQPIDGDEAFALLRSRTTAQRDRPA